MKATIQRLRAEVASDHRAFELRVSELQGLGLEVAPPAAVLAQAAVALHHAYSAVEALMLRVIRFFEGEAPAGPDWHQELLSVMALELAEVRPAIFGPDTVVLLRRLLGFRHFFRHGYAIGLDPRRLAQLAQEAEQVRPMVARDVLALDTLLAELARSSES